MSYTLQRTSDSEEIVSDLESIVGDTRETPSMQDPSLSSRVRVLGVTTVLVAVAMVLFVVSNSSRPVWETKVSATVALSQDSLNASWDQILLEEAHEIDSTWNRLKADQAKFKKTGGWETAHQISKDHERLKMEEADFATAEAMSKQHPDHQHRATANLRATAQASSTVSLSTTPKKPASASVRSEAAATHLLRNPAPKSTASASSAESASTSMAPQQGQVATIHTVEKGDNLPLPTATAKTPESSMPATTTLASQPTRPNAENLSALAEEFLAQAQEFDSTSSDRESMISIANMLKRAEHHIAKIPQTNITQHDSLDGSPLIPKEALHDGNKCPEDEEEYPKTGGTCFKKCSDLTGGTHPIRSSAFSCCKSEPCGVGNSKIHLSFCGGFDVAGDAEGNGCPSSEGACLKDEELLGGICYKKCSTFEGGDVYRHRVAPNICCRTKGMRCMLPSYFKFSAKFAVGGGDGDSNSATPGIPHAPIQEITEVAA